jgi:beta-1,4-mannosyl-glycoprotein beta-1,4-N-acetylglucosaminyltransferase
VTKVFDAFMFFNEYQHLELRLRELHEVVDYFILVEGSKTHTGHPKPFYFRENEAAFAQYRDKLIPIAVDLPAGGKESWFGWGREIFQRSVINAVLAERAQPDDIVLSSDVDEIPRTRVLQEYAGRTDVCAIEEKTYHYNLNTLLEVPTLDPKICRYWNLKPLGVSDLRYYHQAHPVHVIKNGGWHLSFMGGTDKIIEKMKAYAHYDIRDPNIETYVSRKNVEASVKARKSLFLRDDVKYLYAKDYSDLPRHIMENFHRYVDLRWILESV